MGLDMFLTARRRLRTWGEDNDVEMINKLNKMYNIDPVTEGFDDPIKVQELIFTVAYWRKANAIHKWFVDNVQEGKDECQEAWVERAQLQRLVDTCKAVLLDPHKAQELLPTQSGFFFGGTEYDEWYFRDLEFTVERLEKALSMEAFNEMDFFYQSSW